MNSTNAASTPANRETPSKELSSIDDGLWGVEVTDADGYVMAFFQLRNASRS